MKLLIKSQKELLSELNEENNSDSRADIIRELGNFPEPEVIKTLWDLRNNLENEDSFVQYEIKLSLHKVTSHPDVNIDAFLGNLGIFQQEKSISQAPKMLIDANLIEEFLLRDKTTLNQDATKVVEYVLSGKIKPYIGKNGLRNIWLSIKEMKGQEYANRLTIEILSQFNVCEIDLKKIDMEAYPTVNIPTIIQVECAKKYNLDGIITLRDRDFVGSGWPYVYPPRLLFQEVESEEPHLSPESFKEKLAKKFIDEKEGELAQVWQKESQRNRFVEPEETNLSFKSFKEKLAEKFIDGKKEGLAQVWQEEPQRNVFFEDNLPLFQGWKIEKFEILCSRNDLTSATVVLRDRDGKERYNESAFRKGSINALFTAFDKVLSHIVEIKHELKAVYIANLTPGKEGSVTAMAFVRLGDEEVIRIYSHENILKAYLFAYVKAITAIYAPNEAPQDIYEEKELIGLYKIGMRDFRNLNFSKVDLSDNEANLSKSILVGCDFSNANLSGANLTKADLTGADLSKANLSKANLTEANLTEIKLDGNNKALFEETILTNTKMPEIKIAVSGQSRIDKVVLLLEQIDVQKSKCQLFAVHSMTTPAWWYSDLGRYFLEVNKRLLEKSLLIQRVFILPESPTQEHLQIVQEQHDSGVEVRYICCSNAKNVENHDWHNTNVMIFENQSVERNSFTTRMLINEKNENGYISYQQIDIKTDKELFSCIWKKAETSGCGIEIGVNI